MQKQKTERPTIKQIESGEREATFGLGSTHPFDEQMGLPGTLESDLKSGRLELLNPGVQYSMD